MRQRLLPFLAFVLLVAPPVAAEDAAAEKRELQRKLYREVRSLLDEADIATGSSVTFVSRATETPCLISILRTADGRSGGTEVRIALDLRQLNFAAVVPGVHVSSWQGTDYRTHALFIEQAKTNGVTIKAREYREKPNQDGFTQSQVKWTEPQVGLIPRRDTNVLFDRALSDEADRSNVKRLHNALIEFGAACRS